MQTRLKSQVGREIAVLLADLDARPTIPKGDNIRYFLDSNDKELEESRNVFVVATGLNLQEIAQFVKHANRMKRLRGLLLRQESYQSWITQLLDIADVRTLDKLLVHSDNEVVTRILMAWNYGAQDNLIADAAVFGDHLLVRDCALTRYKVPFSILQDLSRIKERDRTCFEISEEGSRLSWRQYDVDINLDSIRSALEPNRARAESAQHDRIYGAAIAKLRKESGLRQADIPGLDERHLRKIESGAQRATSRALEFLARAHRLEVNEYMSKVAQYASSSRAGE